MRRRLRLVPSPQVMPTLPLVSLPKQEYLEKLNAVRDRLTDEQYNEVLANHRQWHRVNQRVNTLVVDDPHHDEPLSPEQREDVMALFKLEKLA